MRYIVIVFFIFSFSFSDEEVHIPKDLSFLNLSSSQKNIIKDILKEYRKKLKKLHHQEEKWEKDVKTEFKKNNFNPNKLLVENIKIRTDTAKIEMEFFSKIHKVLNISQRKKFIKYIEEWEIE